MDLLGIAVGLKCGLGNIYPSDSFAAKCSYARIRFAFVTQEYPQAWVIAESAVENLREADLLFDERQRIDVIDCATHISRSIA